MNPPDTDLDLIHDLPERRSSRPPAESATTPSDQAARMPPAVAAPSLTEQTLGDFHLLRKLGSGGMADVYLAEQLSLKRKVAVKVLRAELVRESDDVVLKRFEREARAAAGLTHPNIVQVYTIGAQNGVHYIAQEYVEGINLREFLKRKGPPGAALAVRFMGQIAKALDCAGRAGIVHRDIKPENILITRKGDAKIGDFGLAQLTQPGERLHLTQPNVTMGTPLYMSPEQVNGKSLDQRSDIYSFGVTCYHLLAGSTPFRGETALSVAVQHLNQHPRPLSELRSDLPPALCAVVHKMMAKKPDDRYPDAAAIVQDLKLIAKALKQDPQEAAETLAKFDGMVPASALPSRGLWDRLSRWSLRRAALALTALGIVVGGAAAGLGWWLRPGNPLETPPRTMSRIPKLSSPEAQYTVALWGYPGEQEEEAWQAVIDFFADDADSEYPWMAREQLGIIYLRSLRLDAAARIFEEFLRSGQLQGKPERRARGEAGRAIIANLRGDYAGSQEIIDRRLAPDAGSEALLNHLESSSELRRFLEQAQVANRQHLEPTAASTSASG